VILWLTKLDLQVSVSWLSIERGNLELSYL
jgi:hypothetical protein